MIPFETIEIDEMVAACAGGPGGGSGPLGHPRVYLNLAPSGRVECPYCSRQFLNRAVAGLNASGAGGVGEEAGVVMPSPDGPGAERLSESPAPRQVGEIAADPAGGADG